jgi:hypothetical protein
MHRNNFNSSLLNSTLKRQRRGDYVEVVDTFRMACKYMVSCKRNWHNYHFALRDFDIQRQNIEYFSRSIELDYFEDNMAKNTQFNGFSFAKIDMTDADFADFDNWINTSTVDKLIPLLLEDGYKLSLAFVADSGSFSATISGNSEHSKNPNSGLSSFSDDVFEAIQLTAYKHIVMAKRGVWTTSKKRLRG